MNMRKFGLKLREGQEFDLLNLFLILYDFLKWQIYNFTILIDKKKESDLILDDFLLN